ncbi:MAG: hypothetical protein R3F61_14080 [Myxococcota bacterium]
MRLVSVVVLALAGCKKSPTPPGVVDGVEGVDAIFERFIEVSGGREQLASVRNLRSEAVATMPATNVSMSMVMYQERPDHYLTEVTLPGIGTVRSGHADGITWEVHPTLGPRLLSGAEADDAVRRNRLDVFEAYESHYPERTLTGTVEFAGTRCSRVEARTSSGTPETLYFAVDTGLWMGSQLVAATQGGEMNMTNVVEAYTRVDGVLTATLTRQSVGGFEIVTRFLGSEANLDDFPDLTPPPEILELQGM